jgi:hypothetical protein
VNGSFSYDGNPIISSDTVEQVVSLLYECQVKQILDLVEGLITQIGHGDFLRSMLNVLRDHPKTRREIRSILTGNQKNPKISHFDKRFRNCMNQVRKRFADVQGAPVPLIDLSRKGLKYRSNLRKIISTSMPGASEAVLRRTEQSLVTG